jgi:biopolymer transport protein ExbD
MTVKIDKGRALDGINLTPMIDCVFLLLIFFLVATRFEEIEREMSITLPQASEAMPLTAKPKELFVNVSQEGRFIVSGQELGRAELYTIIEQAAANNPGTQTVIIRADKRCPFEHVVVVMDLCNKAHIRNYMVTTAEPERGRTSE